MKRDRRTMKNGKRILSVCIKRMVDESPDTSWLGEYGSKAESEYAIDRGHDTECACQSFNAKTKKAKRILEHVQQTLGDMQEEYRNVNHDREFIHDTEWDALEDAYNEVEELLDTASECDCWQQGARDTRSYEYFNPNHENYAGLPEADIVKYCLQDYERMEAYNNGHFCFIGIRAYADVSIPSGQSAVESEVSSGGLWGIESDSGSYLEEVEQEQLAELKEPLRALGFSSRAISTAFKNVTRKED